MNHMKSETDFEFDLYREKIVSSVVAAAGGKLVGRVRLQKIIYLLDQLGLNSPYSYQYYHYGPYSEELSNPLSSRRLLISSGKRRRIERLMASDSMCSLPLKSPTLRCLGNWT